MPRLKRVVAIRPRGIKGDEMRRRCGVARMKRSAIRELHRRVRAGCIRRVAPPPAFRFASCGLL